MVITTLFAFFFFFSRVTEILKYREIIWWRDAASRWASWLTSRMSQFRLVSPTWPIKMHTITKQQVARVIWFWYIRIAISFLFFYTGVTSNAGHDYFYWFSLSNLDLFNFIYLKIFITTSIFLGQNHRFLKFTRHHIK